MCSFLIFVNLICSDDHGDRPRPLPVVIELKNAIDITERTGSPSWDYDVKLFHCYFIRFSYYILIGLRMSMNMSFLHRREKKNAGCGKSLHHLAENWWIVEIWKMGRQK